MIVVPLLESACIFKFFCFLSLNGKSEVLLCFIIHREYYSNSSLCSLLKGRGDE